jgi:hypothetical protein
MSPGSAKKKKAPKNGLLFFWVPIVLVMLHYAAIKMQVGDNGTKKTHAPFVRPSKDVLKRMQREWEKSVTTINFRPKGSKNGDSKDIPKEVRLETGHRLGQKGHTRLPDIFYTSTFYLISGWNPGGTEVTNS